MPVHISIDTDITLSGLVEKHRQGYITEETPHVGNLSASTLATLTLGLSVKLVDVTIGSKDNLFYPHCKIAGGTRTIIADPNIMTTHNTVQGCTTSLSDFHFEPFADKAFNICTHSSWMARRQEIIVKVIEASLQKIPSSHQLWERHVSKNGIVHQQTPNDDFMGKIHKVTSSPTDEGWVVPNPFNILFDLICGSIESGKPTVYMLSGQSMYKYISQPYRNFGRMDLLISALYDAARDFGIQNLPKDLEVIMVPIPVTRHFVSPRRMQTQLDRKLQYFDQMIKDNARCGKKISTRELSAEVSIGLRQKRRTLFNCAAQPLSQICADSESGLFYSHHDMDENQDTIYVPEYVMDIPIRVMVDKVKKMKNLLT